MAEVTFEIVKKFGELGVSAKGWTKEINLVSWNKYPAKYDIREWDPDHLKMSKGLTLNKEELLKLREILNAIELE